MDAGHINPTRKFPSYTTASLKASVAQYDAGTHPLQATTSVEHIAAIKTEIANREAGISKHFVVPQLNGPMTIKTI